MFRTRRPPTLSINELNHILSESLDFENIPETVIHHDPLLLMTPDIPKSSTFQRLFSRSSPHLSVVSRSPTDQVGKPITPSPRKMAFTWCLPRLSPRKSRRARDHAAKSTVCDSGVPVDPPNRPRSSSVASAAQTRRPLTSTSSSSSLGSMIPPSECIFNRVAEGAHIGTQNGVSTILQSQLPSPAPVNPQLSPLQMPHFPSSPHSPIPLLFGSKSSLNLVPTLTHEEHAFSSVGKNPSTPVSDLNDAEPSDDDNTPRAAEFPMPPSHKHSGSTIQAKQRRRPSILTLVLPQETPSLCLQPAIGVTPHVPSDTDSFASVCSLPSPTSSTKSPTSTTSSDLWSRARPGSRTILTPPFPGPPPSCPLPPPPTSTAPDLSTPSTPQSLYPVLGPSPSKRRCTPVRNASPSGRATCIPSSSLGNLRLPSRLSWGATGRAVLPASSLPSPPSSPSKEGRKKKPSSGSLGENGTSITTCPTLGKSASMGVLEAASDLEAQVRRTKSILVLGSRRSKGVLSCSDSPPKRVQIHAEANSNNVGSSPKKKQRRQSSGASTMPFFAVPRERRRSAPLLGSGITSKSLHISPLGADWTLSLPFCIDVPGSGIILPTPPSEDGALHEADEALKVAQDDDWTLSLGVDRQTIAHVEKGVVDDNTQAKNSMEEQSSVVTQLPTPSTTPEPQDSTILPSLPSGSAPSPRRFRPVSPASLGPHCGGLDLDGGRGKRGSGWDVCGWFGPSDMDEPKKTDTRPVSMFASEASWIRRSTDTDAPRRSDVGFTRQGYEKWMRHLSEDSTVTAHTAETIYYSARTSILVV